MSTATRVAKMAPGDAASTAAAHHAGWPLRYVTVDISAYTDC